jgi:hypothetical protein
MSSGSSMLAITFKRPPQAPRPVHANVLRRRPLRYGGVLAHPWPPSCWRDRRSQRRVRREHSMKSRQMYPRRRHERREASNEVQGERRRARGGTMSGRVRLRGCTAGSAASAQIHRYWRATSLH